MARPVPLRSKPRSSGMLGRHDVGQVSLCRFFVKKEISRRRAKQKRRDAFLCIDATTSFPIAVARDGTYILCISGAAESSISCFWSIAVARAAILLFRA